LAPLKTREINKGQPTRSYLDKQLGAWSSSLEQLALATTAGTASTVKALSSPSFKHNITEGKLKA
jgi:hypothetical protein